VKRPKKGVLPFVLRGLLKTLVKELAAEREARQRAEAEHSELIHQNTMAHDRLRIRLRSAEMSLEACNKVRQKKERELDIERGGAGIRDQLRSAEAALLQWCDASTSYENCPSCAHFARYQTLDSASPVAVPPTAGVASEEPAPASEGPRCNGRCGSTVVNDVPIHDPACPLHGEPRDEAEWAEHARRARAEYERSKGGE
jgi:hypothetical protein